MPRVKCWQVDAFTNRPFAGNPAAVCWLEKEASPGWMQAVASEMNLSETSFVRRIADGLELRWFTPIVEVDLCGHATLAAARALWFANLASPTESLRFHTRSGWLTCKQEGDFIELDFPALPVRPITPPPTLLDSLGVTAPHFIGQSKFDYFVALDSAEAVHSVRPDYRAVGELPVRGVIVTAPSNDPAFDFVSRFFAPAVGVDEDPVCGSAHCSLTAYWSERLNKTELMARQVSPRGGILRLKFLGDRVRLGGQAVVVWQGELLSSEE